MRVTKRARRRMIALGAAVVVLVGGVLVWRVTRKAQVQRLIAAARVEGMDAFHQGDYANALDKLRYYNARRRGDVEAMIAQADSRAKVPELNARHLSASAGLYREVLLLEPENRAVLARLVEMYPRLGRRREAMEIADRLLALDIDNIEALAAKGSALTLDGRFQDALGYLERLVRLEPEHMAWRVSLLEVRRRQGAADEELIALCDSWPDEAVGDGRLHLVKAQLLLELGRTDEARREAQLAMQRGADAPEVLRAMIELSHRLGVGSEAQDLVAQTRAKFGPVPWVTEAAVRWHWQAQLPDEALAVLEKAEEAGPLDAELLRWKALLLMDRGRNQEAAGVLGALVALAAQQAVELRDANRLWAEALLACLRSDQFTWLALLGTYQSAQAVQPSDPVLHYLTGDAYARVGEHGFAARAFESATACDPYWAAAQLARARALLNAGRPVEALAVVVPWVGAHPRSTLNAYILLAQAWLAADPTAGEIGLYDPGTGKPLGIVELLEQIHEKSGPDPVVLRLLFEAYHARGLPAAAAAMAEELLAGDEPDSQALLALAETSQARNAELASRLVRRAREVAGLTLEVAAAEARLLHIQGRTEEGLALIDEARASSPDEGAVRAGLVRASYLAWAKHPQALAAMERLLDANPASATVATFVLSEPIAWSNAPLISKAIDSLAAVVGEEAAQTCLARANYVLEFEAGDAAKLAEATAKVNEVLKLAPGSLRALSLMSRLVLSSDVPDFNLAITHLERAIRLYPQRADLYPHLISLLQRQGDFEGAGGYLQRFDELAEGHPDLRRLEVQLLEAQGDFSTAALRMSAVLGNSPAESEQLVLASLHHRAGNYAEAERIYSRVLADPGRSIKAVAAAAGFYASVGRFEEGLGLLTALQPEGESAGAELLLLLGEFHQAHGDPEDAGRLFRAAVAADPAHVEAWTRLAAHALSAGDNEQARQAAMSGLAVKPDDPSLQVALAVAAMNLGRTGEQDASNLLHSATAENPGLAATSSLYDRVVTGDGALKPTSHDLADAAKLVHEYPQLLPAWHLAVALNAEAGELDQAVRLARRAVDRLPAQAEPAEWATRLLIKAGRLEEALGMAEIWRSRSVQQVVAVDVIIASLLLDLGRPSRAVERLAPHAKEIYARRDRFPDRLAIRLRALLAAGRFEQAATLVEPLLAEGEPWHTTWLQLALTAEDDVARQALALSERFVQADPQRTLLVGAAWLSLGQRTGLSSDYDRAEALAGEAAATDSTSAESLKLRASIAVERGELGVAESRCRAILAREPDDLGALNNMAYILLQVGGRSEEALSLSARAEALAPKNPDVLDTRAQALAACGRLEEAERVAQLAVTERPDDPRLLVTMTSVLVAQLRFIEADVVLARAETYVDAAQASWRALRDDIRLLRQRIDEAKSSS